MYFHAPAHLGEPAPQLQIGPGPFPNIRQKMPALFSQAIAAQNALQNMSAFKESFTLLQAATGNARLALNQADPEAASSQAGQLVRRTIGCTSTPRLRNALAAAPAPHMPCTPPPGGVEAEHKNMPSTPVAYGSSANPGRPIIWSGVFAPPPMSPPT